MRVRELLGCKRFELTPVRVGKLATVDTFQFKRGVRLQIDRTVVIQFFLHS